MVACGAAGDAGAHPAKRRVRMIPTIKNGRKRFIINSSKRVNKMDQR
jgi:hypothetical protein